MDVRSAIRIISFSFISLFLAVIFLINKGATNMEKQFKKEYELFRSIKVGMSKEEVVKLLGTPYKIYRASEAPENYYIEGYSYKKGESLTKSVYILELSLLRTFILMLKAKWKMFLLEAVRVKKVKKWLIQQGL